MWLNKREYNVAKYEKVQSSVKQKTRQTLAERIKDMKNIQCETVGFEQINGGELEGRDKFVEE